MASMLERALPRIAVIVIRKMEFSQPNEPNMGRTPTHVVASCKLEVKAEKKVQRNRVGINGAFFSIIF